MTSSILSLPILCFFAFFIFIAGGFVKPVNSQAPGQGAWCIPKPSASDKILQDNIDFACGAVGESECSVIKPGGLCVQPCTLFNHASVVMNLYYQKMGRNFWNCDFKSSGIVAVTDPSYGGCKYIFAQ